MKRVFPFVMFCLSLMIGSAQQYYWVILSDKGNATFDPYSYFDAHAIARYQACGADLYDISNYPVDDTYRSTVDGIVNEEIGVSRWFNAIAVAGTDEQLSRVARLPFVKAVLPIGGDMEPATHELQLLSGDSEEAHVTKNYLTPQIRRMGAAHFVNKGLDGSGIRIAVLDGGFPKVDSHPAFAHLREQGHIIDTWNFPAKKADVYGWNTHGTMTLSCIVGIFKGRQLGLATGAEVMLYRTEIGLEPRKEEVWWIMGMERADQHGADIISSSLGYGKERYNPTDMDGTSLVARGGNLAARKGILVCNSAGNEGTEQQWKTIVTPADADSVLCVGGITPSLSQYKHIYFSSYGPSADGRLKPNVSAFGTALAAVHLVGIDTLMSVDGTSFSCPLVAGFAACAWQSNRSLSAMQLKESIERSADLYPYFDYAVGYGVPQASFFTERPHKHEPTFRMEESLDSVTIRIDNPDDNTTVFYNKQMPNGMLDHYATVEVSSQSPVTLRFHKASLDSCTLNVWYNGYTNSYILSTADQIRWSESKPFRATISNDDNDAISNFRMDRSLADNIPISRGIGGRHYWEVYFDLGCMIHSEAEALTLHRISLAPHIGIRRIHNLGKYYGLGLAFEWSRQNYNLDKESNNPLDTRLGLAANKDVKRKRLYHNDWVLEAFQRICFVHGGMLGRGIYWDLGVYGSYSNFHYRLTKEESAGVPAFDVNYDNPRFDGRYFWNWGLTTRIGYDLLAVYGRYRMTTYNIDNAASCKMQLPRLEVGIELNL